VLLRKFYSIVAFGLIGFVLDEALPRIRRRAVRAALIVAAFSAVIEVAQKFRGAREGPLSEAIDIACGALGAWLAVTIASNVRDRRRP
jgi:VanZ family protein